MKFVVLTGMSGAGKTTALKFFEDIGYFCVDNLPPSLLPKFLELCTNQTSELENVALGIDIRGRKFFEDLFDYLEDIENKDFKVEILFLDATDDVLVKRFKESRRTHPLTKTKSIKEGIEEERELLQEIKEKADYIIDTSSLLSRQLKETINSIFIEDRDFTSLVVNIISFGFKYGIPQDADLVFDVRFIPNPFYIPELRDKTGNDREINDYVMKWDESKIFLEKLTDMIKFLIPNYIKEGKTQLVIAIGCTGGKHRSVTLANKLYENIIGNDFRVIKTHKDIDKGKEK